MDDNFYELLCQLGLSQHVTSPTRGNNLLDVVLSAGTSIVLDVWTLPMVGVADHPLVAGKIKTLWQSHKFIILYQQEHQEFKQGRHHGQAVEVWSFLREHHLLQWVCELDPIHSNDVKWCLDVMASLKTRKKQVGRACNRWLSDEAVKAKRNRRRLERKWKISHSEADQTAYREACRSANTQINSSRQSHYQTRLNDTRSQPREHWKVVNELLHTEPEQRMSTENEDQALCISFATFFKDKISAIGNRLWRIVVGVVFDPLDCDEKFSGESPLHSFEHVTVDEVSRWTYRRRLTPLTMTFWSVVCVRRSV